MSGSNKARRIRIVLISLMVLVGLGLGLVLGWWLATRRRAGPEPAAAATSQATELWYTCGMHPNVIQKGPGNCPICGMKLTPLRSQPGTEQAAGGPKRRKILYWRAPMNPNYVSDRPGKSPMGMDLVPVYADEGESISGPAVRIDPVTIQNMGIRTAMVKRGPLVKTIRTIGRVDYDEQTVTFLNTKFEGWIEKLYVDETGQHVRKGEPLFDVYSPQLYSAQEEYLAALRGLKTLSASAKAVQAQARRLVEAARIKLAYLDISDEQIDRLAATGKIQKTMTIHCPVEGIVTEKAVLEGMYVKPGMRLYTIADLSRVWVYLDVFEYQLPWIRLGQTATMTLPYVAGKQFTGKVVYIYPYLEPRTRVVKVRLEFENPALELKPGMYANVTLAADLDRQALLIPREAYIDSGTRKVAFVDLGNGRFEPREIQVGIEAEDGMVEVLDGLDEGEVVVTSGQFMLDAESRLQEAVAKMIKPARASVSIKPAQSGPSQRPAGQHHRPGSMSMSASQPTATRPAEARFACPMQTHPDQADPAKRGPYFSSGPGRCPRCGMELKPIDTLPWAGVREAAQDAAVAYTCPDHQHMVSRSPGTCPRCGRQLEPFKLMYTCRDPKHAAVVHRSPGTCPRCGKALVPFRGIWLSKRMAEANLPATTQPVAGAAYRCPRHPLVHSDAPGACTICAEPLQPVDVPAAPTTTEVTGRRPAPSGQAERVRKAPGVPPTSRPREGRFLCPMHPNQVRRDKPGICPICAMQLVPADRFARPTTAPARVRQDLDYVMEHYLGLHRLLASDNTKDLARHALGLAAASSALREHVTAWDTPKQKRVAKLAARLHDAALKITGRRIEQDRIVFVQISEAMISLLDQLRPDKQRWPRLFIFHCPMNKADWVQANRKTANPYYGFKMLECGQVKQTK